RAQGARFANRASIHQRPSRRAGRVPLSGTRLLRTIARMKLFQELIDNVRGFVATVGAVALFFARVLGQVPRAILRPGFIVEQIYNAGALSLVIIMTCGLFVGMVLGLQGYDLLQRFGSEDALGTGAALDRKSTRLNSSHVNS